MYGTLFPDKASSPVSYLCVYLAEDLGTILYIELQIIKLKCVTLKLLEYDYKTTYKVLYNSNFIFQIFLC